MGLKNEKWCCGLKNSVKWCGLKNTIKWCYGGGAAPVPIII